MVAYFIGNNLRSLNFGLRRDWQSGLDYVNPEAGRLAGHRQLLVALGASSRSQRVVLMIQMFDYIGRLFCWECMMLVVSMMRNLLVFRENDFWEGLMQACMVKRGTRWGSERF